VKAVATPFARAAGDVFATVLLFQVAPEVERPSLGAFRTQMLGLIESFVKSSQAQQAAPGDVEEARFALVAWIDECVNTCGWKSTAEWERDPLQRQLFGTRRAGVEFFEHLEKLRPENADALEVYFLCLALGFRGDYADRDADRRLIVQRTLEKLRRVGRALDPQHEKRLTPFAYQMNITLKGRGSRLVRTLLAIAVGTAALFAVLFGVLWLIASRVPLLTGGP